VDIIAICLRECAVVTDYFDYYKITIAEDYFYYIGLIILYGVAAWALTNKIYSLSGSKALIPKISNAVWFCLCSILMVARLGLLTYNDANLEEITYDDAPNLFSAAAKVATAFYFLLLCFSGSITFFLLLGTIKLQRHGVTVGVSSVLTMHLSFLSKTSQLILWIVTHNLGRLSLILTCRLCNRQRGGSNLLRHPRPLLHIR
jgi:hypothetical protein